MRAKGVGRDIENLASREVAPPKRQGVPPISVDQLRELAPILRFLNQKDRDILYLIFVARKKQKEVQRILGRSQPSLCYDIRRIRRRLKFICYLLSAADTFLDFIAYRSEDFDSETKRVLVLMFYTTSFTHTAKILSKRQIRVRYVFEKALEQLEEAQMWDIYEIFNAVRDNLNIVKRVYRDGTGKRKKRQTV